MDLTDVPAVRSGDEDPPDFDDWEDPEALLTDGPVRERLLDVALQLREPTTVATVAERAGCDPGTAREYLGWFAEMGVVREHRGRPVRYDLNRGYRRWRRVERIRDEFTDEAIVSELDATVAELEEYRDRFDAEHPADVSLLDVDGLPLGEAWDLLTAWETARERAALLDAARRDGSASGRRSLGIDA